MKKSGFMDGIVYAAGYLAYYHGEDTLAVELLKSAGISSLKDLRASGADAYDIGLVKSVFEGAA